MTDPLDGSEHVSRDAAGRLRYTPAVRTLRPWSTLVILLIAMTTVRDVAVLGAMWLGVDVSDLWRSAGDFEPFMNVAIGITCPVLWCLWQHAAVTNLAKRSPSAQRYSASRGIWAWFIPFVNFVRPAYVILDLWRGSEALLPCDGPRRPASGAGIVIVVVWWAAHVAPFLMIPVAIMGGAAFGGTMSVQDAFGLAIPAVHGTLACVIVHRITRMQDAWIAGDADAESA